MKFLLILALQTADVSEMERLAIQHGNRLKPFDTFAREMMSRWTGRESKNPTASILDVVFRSEESGRKEFFRVQHPELKKKLGLSEDRHRFSVEELEARRDVLESLHQKASQMAERDRGPLDRAVLDLGSAYTEYVLVSHEVLLRVIPIEYGANGSWVSPFHLREFLRPSEEPPPMEEDLAASAVAMRAVPRERLESLLGMWETLRRAWGGGEFAAASRKFVEAMRELNPSRYPDRKLLESEVRYHRIRPFTWAAALYGGTFLLFLFSSIFASRILWGGGIFVLLSAMGVHLYSYFWRWEIAQRFPLSNQYEAMLAIAFLVSTIALIFECVLRSRFIGLGAGLIGGVMISLADAVSDFSPYIKALPPALQSIWMTIHVPTILTGYSCGALMAVLGHIYIFTYLFAPARQETLKRLDTYLYRVLQVTVLFLLSGLILGGIWAKEAWGRFWGWDMKETWALISFLGYLATLHARFAGAIKGLGTAVCSILGVTLVFLTFYGVNYIFGRGLHTYGFGAGSWTPLLAFFAAEAAVAGSAFVVFLGRRRSAA